MWQFLFFVVFAGVILAGCAPAQEVPSAQEVPPPAGVEKSVEEEPGAYRVLHDDAERGLLVYARTRGPEVTVTALNWSGEAHSLRVELPEELRGAYREAFTTRDDAYRVQQDATALLLELPSDAGIVLERE